MRRPSALALLAATVAATSANAGPIAISPTTVEIADGRRSAVVEVRNPGTTPVDLQFRAYAWSQAGGRDQLTPTDDVIVSPPIATLAPGATQLFRVLRPAPARADREDSYRLRLNQLPQRNAGGVGINLEFLLPLFAGGGTLAPRLRLADAAGGTRIANEGGRHVKIGALEIARPGAAPDTYAPARATYILPGATMDVPHDGPPAAKGVRIVAHGDRGPVDVAEPTLVASR